MNQKQTMIASVLAGIGASLCCVAPLVLLSLGLGGAWVANLTAFEPGSPDFYWSDITFPWHVVPQALPDNPDMRTRQALRR